MIVIKRVYEPPSPADGHRVLVDRLWPRGVKREDAAVGEWLKELAPSPDLRRWFAHDPERWPEFARRYREELQAPAAAAQIGHLRELAKRGTVTLLYAARDERHNNAEVLRSILTDESGDAAPPSQAARSARKT